MFAAAEMAQPQEGRKEGRKAVVNAVQEPSLILLLLTWVTGSSQDRTVICGGTQPQVCPADLVNMHPHISISPFDRNDEDDSVVLNLELVVRAPDQHPAGSPFRDEQIHGPEHWNSDCREQSFLFRSTK